MKNRKKPRRKPKKKPRSEETRLERLAARPLPEEPEDEEGPNRKTQPRNDD